VGTLEGRVAIVTGAGQGLGRSHALLLAREGARVVVNDLGTTKDGFGEDANAAHAVVEEIRAFGGEAVANAASVTDWEAMRALVDDTIATYGDLHVVVNNAGILRDRVVYNMSEDAWDAVIAVHMKGTFATTHFASAYWRDQTKSGADVRAAIVNTSSVAGIFCTSAQSAYGTAKAAIAAFTVICAKDLRRFGVRVNAICPSARTRLTTDTAVSSAWATAEVPEGSFDELDPANVSAVVAYLATEDCPLTGEVLGAGAGRLSRFRGWSETAHALQDREWSVDDVALAADDWSRSPKTA
jgi:NAD(P)-dependent dehydrogenase (short-subunit alcohol dehydrogenase family)